MGKKPSEKTLHTSGKMLGVGKDGYQKGGNYIQTTFRPTN